MLGKLQRLRCCGCLCPCIESREDHATRIADLALQSVPIQWYRRIRTFPSFHVKGDGIDGTCGIFDCNGSANQVDDGKSKRHKRRDIPQTTAYIGIRGTLNVMDAPSGPAICVTSDAFEFIDEDPVGSGILLDRRRKKKTIMRKIVPLHEIDAVMSCESLEPQIHPDVNCGVTILAEPARFNNPNKEGTGEWIRLLQFDVIVDGFGDHALFQLSRDEVVRHLQTLVQWSQFGQKEARASRRRMSRHGPDEDGHPFVLMTERKGSELTERRNNTVQDYDDNNDDNDDNDDDDKNEEEMKASSSLT